MSPARTTREESVDNTEEYGHFLEQLRAFHQQRGTSFDPAPRVGNHRVDLLRLYRRVVNDGGYDAVSNTKQQKLAWRTISQDFHLGTANLALMAFNLKTVYYKNLAAYEIVDIHKKIPPPKEILEDISAKGGDLLTRTYENFGRPTKIDERNANGAGEDGSDADSQRTPDKDRMELDEPGSTGARRNLRQAPPQRVLFQPDTSSSRQSRQLSNHAHSPTPTAPMPTMNGHSTPMYMPAPMPQSLASYEPKQQFPLTLRPVTTPANNPEAFRALQNVSREASQPRFPRGPRNIMLPGTGFTGPNIYSRILLALQSGIPEEQEYALHHLVKISHERGDKYRFDQFVGLAESLVEKVLEVSSLFSRVEWKITYDDTRPTANADTLDGLNGTLHILERLQFIKPSPVQDSMQTKRFSGRLVLINEAALVIRNMIFLEENAEYISRFPSFKDLLTILINLPNKPALVEVKQYAFEMAEQMTRYYPASPDDPLLKSLKGFIDSSDRAIVLASLRAVSRMGTQLENVAPLQEIPPHVLKRVSEWLLVEDSELIGACLVFLYRYTTVVANIDSLFEHIDVEALVKQVTRTLMHGARTLEERRDTYPPKPASTKPQPASDGEAPIPRIPTDLVEQLLGYDEPERSSQWLRTCFEEDPGGEITQIALWQAYQIPFAPYAAQRPLLPAKDFITNVSTTFSRASAQVINGPSLRFVIKGIRPRAAPVDRHGRNYMRCLWHLDTGTECGEFALGPKQMWEHVVYAHLNLAKGADGLYNFEPKDSRLYACRWAGCQRFTLAEEAVSPFSVGMHIKTHLPDTSTMAYQRSKHNIGDVDGEGQPDRKRRRSSSVARPQSPYTTVHAVGGPTPGQTPSLELSTPAAQAQPPPQSPTRTWTLHNTQFDERRDAAGLPLTSALILRNLARNIPRTDAAVAEEAKAGSFSPVASRNRQTFADGLSAVALGVVDAVPAPPLQATGDALLWRVFAPVRGQLFWVMAYNQVLREYLAFVVRAISPAQPATVGDESPTEEHE